MSDNGGPFLKGPFKGHYVCLFEFKLQQFLKMVSQKKQHQGSRHTSRVK
jgi:hypothetical protein